MEKNTNIHGRQGQNISASAGTYRLGTKCRKPDYELLAPGTICLWDVANLFGDIGPHHAAHVLGKISSALSAIGCKSLFFLEHRALGWAIANQVNDAEREALREFVRRKEVALVGGDDEADSVILQVAEVEPNSIVVSGDFLEDYKKAHPDIVNTNRVRHCSWLRVDGKIYLAFRGLKCSIAIDDPAQEIATAAPEREEPVSAVEQVSFVEPAPVEDAVPSGAYTDPRAEKFIAQGSPQKALAFYAKAAKRDPEAYFALAAMYDEGNGVPEDRYAAAKYERLGHEQKKRRRECDLRYRRLYAEAVADGHAGNRCHFSAKRRRELRIAAFAEYRQSVCDYRVAQKGGMAA